MSYYTINKFREQFIVPRMSKLCPANRNLYCTSSKSASHLHQSEFGRFQLKQYSPRKSLFNPQEGIAETYAARNHIAGADVPIIEVIHSTKRWLLLQAPRYTLCLFKRINSGSIANPFETLLRIFKSFFRLANIYGFFVPSARMIFCRKKGVCVWINSDIFSNLPEESIPVGQEAEERFVRSFLKICEEEIIEWQKTNNIFTVEETIKLLDWLSKLRRGSLTAVQASREVFCRANESKTSFEHSELQFYNNQIRGYMSVQYINTNTESICLQADMSSSVTIKEDEKSLLRQKIEKKLLCDSKSMKFSIYDDVKSPESPQEVRKTKKKFNLTSTSSTLEKFSEKLVTTVGRKKNFQPNISGKIIEEDKERKNKEDEQHYSLNRNTGMHRSEPPSIANELDDLFAQDNQLRFGEEGNKEELEKIAEEIEQVLIG